MTWCHYVVHFKCNKFGETSLVPSSPSTQQCFFDRQMDWVSFPKMCFAQKIMRWVKKKVYLLLPSLQTRFMFFMADDEETLPKCLLPRSVRIPIWQKPSITWWQYIVVHINCNEWANVGLLPSCLQFRFIFFMAKWGRILPIFMLPKNVSISLWKYPAPPK